MDFQRIVYLIVLNHLKNIWLQEDRDTRASELRSQKWSRYKIEEKKHPFPHKGRGDSTKSKVTPFSQRRARRPFSIAVFTCTVTTSIASSGTRSTYHLFSIGLWSSHCLALLLTEWLDEHLINVTLNAETKEIADVDLLIDNLVTPWYKVDHRLFRASKQFGKNLATISHCSMTVDNLVIADDSLELFGCGLFKTFRKSILSLKTIGSSPILVIYASRISDLEVLSHKRHASRCKLPLFIKL